VKVNTFCRLFLLNETARFDQNSVVSCTVYKKKKNTRAQNGAVLNDTVTFLLPLDARGRGRRRFFFLPLSPSSNLQKDADLPTTFHVLDGWWRGGSTMVAPATSPLFLPIKTGEEDQKRGERTRERENITEGRRKREEEEEKRGEERKKNRKKEKTEKRTKYTGRRRRKSSATVPPAPAAQPRRHRR